jgi:uncharacterized coiled-coil DUF342 family protein
MPDAADPCRGKIQDIVDKIQEIKENMKTALDKISTA